MRRTLSDCLEGPYTNKKNKISILLWFLLGILLFSVFAEAQVKIPGTNHSAKLDAAGSLLKIVDTALFVWGARLLAGVSLLSAFWAVKDQKLNVAFLCVISGIGFATCPLWITNLFQIFGGNGIFGN